MVLFSLCMFIVCLFIPMAGSRITALLRRTCRRCQQYLQVSSSAVRHVDTENYVLEKIDLVVLTFAAGRFQGDDHFTAARHHSVYSKQYTVVLLKSKQQLLSCSTPPDDRLSEQIQTNIATSAHRHALPMAV